MEQLNNPFFINKQETINKLMSIKKPGILKHVKKSKSQFANYFYFSFEI